VDAELEAELESVAAAVDGAGVVPTHHK
jgi:hypothetical protein